MQFSHSQILPIWLYVVSGVLIKMHLKIWQITYGIVFYPVIGKMQITTMF